MQPTEIIITNILPTGTAFAVLQDDMTQSVFIPSKLSLDFGFSIGEKTSASLIPNPTHGDKTPWLAIALHNGAGGKTPQPDLADRIRDELANGPATAFELARFIDADVKDVQDRLSLMSLPRIDLYALDMSELMNVAS